MTSHVYFVQIEGGGPIKIGLTTSDPRRRHKGLKTGCPWPTVLLGAIPGGRDDERKLHQELIEFRMEGEWFSPHPDVLAAIDGALASPLAWRPARRQPKHDHPIAHYRAANGVTLHELAKRSGFSVAALSRIESGSLKPSAQRMGALSRVTGIPTCQLRPDLAAIFGAAQ